MGLSVLVFLRVILTNRRIRKKKRHEGDILYLTVFIAPCHQGFCPIQRWDISGVLLFSLCYWYSCGSFHCLSPGRASSVPAVLYYKGQLLLLLLGSVSFRRSMYKTTSHFLSKQKFKISEPVQKTVLMYKTYGKGSITAPVVQCLAESLPSELKQLCACPAFSCQISTWEEVSDIKTE